MADVLNFEQEKDRRKINEIMDDHDHWEKICNMLQGYFELINLHLFDKEEEE